ncbi:MAG: hypothetical protein GAK31_00953 [Stenotrophomonas maltophilia]|uniref:Mor transcription activator domain-containing protein n=1 Tax=Stenotrophomonas maltophilia TaxID=40324 RepID=A0A7V8FKC4_STEMA|nr:MAG: hypothetical protein GAK31_00953 [Stenotrophomonas maltophilia]
MRPVGPLPRSVQEVAEVIGRDAALRLVGELPRAANRPWVTWCYVPHRMGEEHALVKLLGMEAAQKLARVFGGEMLTLSGCSYALKRSRNQSIVQMRQSGASVHSIACAYGLTGRQVRNILAEIPQMESGVGEAEDGSSQMDLFCERRI